MKKLFLFIGVIMLCLFFSCKKDSSSSPPPPPPIDSFLLHPPPVLDSLPIPLTIGTWWKYQRNDSVSASVFGEHYDSSIELLTVLGKTSIVNTVNEIKNDIITRTRYDTVNAFMLELKNLTKGRVDTNFAFYYNAHFVIKSARLDTTFVNLKLPQSEGKFPYYDNYYEYSELYVKKDTAITVNNIIQDNCTYTYDYTLKGWPNSFIYKSKTFMKPNVGFIFWYMQSNQTDHYVKIDVWSVRRLIDYHIAP